MRFSEYFKLQGFSQKDFEFLDIRVDWDNELFIDPTRIAAEKNVFSAECDRKIQNYFDTVLDIYKDNKFELAKKLLLNSGESNEIFLGYTDGFPRGTGNSRKGLEDLFKYLHSKELITLELIEKIEDISVFVERFGPDKMSDLIASIIKDKLVEFTILQCDKYGIKRTYDYKEKKYWNVKGKGWDDLKAKLPEVEYEGRKYPIVLIPKKFIVSDYLYDSEKYWQKVISKRRQDDHKYNNSPLFQAKATERKRGEYILNKQIIFEEEVKNIGKGFKDYLIEHTKADLSTIKFFRGYIENAQQSNSNNSLSDTEIDKIIEESLQKNKSIINKPSK